MSKPYIIGVVGVRDVANKVYTNEEYIESVMNSHLATFGLSKEDVKIVTGGGKGIESIVVKWCRSNDIPVVEIPPNIQSLGFRKAFIVRNKSIVAESKELVLFWDGVIDVTADCISQAMHMKKKATVYPPR